MQTLNYTKQARLMALLLQHSLIEDTEVESWAVACLNDPNAPRWLVDIEHAGQYGRAAVLDILKRRGEPVISLDTALAFLAILHGSLASDRINAVQCSRVLHAATSRVQIPGEFRYLAASIGNAIREQARNRLSADQTRGLVLTLLDRYACFSKLSPALRAVLFDPNLPVREEPQLRRAAVA